MIHDSRLSFKAKGILTYLLSRPDDWQVYEVEIIKHAKDGRDSVRSGIKELIDCGYIERTERRNEKGQFKGYEYEVYEVPNRSGKSDMGNSDIGQPHTTNNDLTNKEVTNSNKGTKQDLALSFSEFMKLQQLNNDTINVVTYYLDRYKHVKGKEHPRLKEKQWEHVVSNLFYVVDYNNSVDFDLSEDDLILMIEKHFVTTYQDGCDYNILHFMSDGVRVNRMYEVAY